MSGEGQNIFVPFILDSIAEYKPGFGSILEIGSGTGNNLIKLSKMFETYGLELSPEMLAIAKKKDKKSVYLQGGMSEFDIRRKFDVIICMFDSINHLPSLNYWKKTFDCAHHHHLVKGFFYI
ncbi:MAG: methyltransferase domain-containing protein [Nanohaloarchaea archaeon]|nr:methyltransferase domain-containing protein [Candidatus Nanohaloarchaea archaeon]